MTPASWAEKTAAAVIDDLAARLVAGRALTKVAFGEQTLAGVKNVARDAWADPVTRTTLLGTGIGAGVGGVGGLVAHLAGGDAVKRPGRNFLTGAALGAGIGGLGAYGYSQLDTPRTGLSEADADAIREGLTGATEEQQRELAAQLGFRKPDGTPDPAALKAKYGPTPVGGPTAGLAGQVERGINVGAGAAGDVLTGALDTRPGQAVAATLGADVAGTTLQGLRNSDAAVRAAIAGNDKLRHLSVADVRQFLEHGVPLPAPRAAGAAPAAGEFSQDAIRSLINKADAELGPRTGFLGTRSPFWKSRAFGYPAVAAGGLAVQLEESRRAAAAQALNVAREAARRQGGK